MKHPVEIAMCIISHMCDENGNFKDGMKVSDELADWIKVVQEDACEAQHKASWAEDKLTEAYATGFRNGRGSVLGIEANGACYVGIDDSILRVDAKLTENTFRIEVFQKRHGDHWTRLQEMINFNSHLESIVDCDSSNISFKLTTGNSCK